MRCLAIAALLLGTPTMAQDAAVETVNAYGNSMVGVWRVGSPDYIAASGFFSPFQWGPEHRHFCRIAPREEALEMFCVSGVVGNWTVTAENNHVHFAGGSMMLRMVLDGELQDAGHFHGHFQLKISGITYEGSASYDAVRVVPDPDTPDSGGKKELLRRILEQGLAGVPHDDGKRNIPEPPKLGPVTAVTYLGEDKDVGPPRDGVPPPRYAFSVYLASFAQGQRLCGLHQREDGVLDAFRCV